MNDKPDDLSPDFEDEIRTALKIPPPKQPM